MTNDLTPGHLNSATFRTVRKGYDPAEVDVLLRDAAASLEHAQQHAAAMEARARAAVARLHEQPEGAAPAPEPTAAPQLSSDDANRISRTLLLAQETADRAIAEANEAAQSVLEQARTEAGTTLESARDESATILDEARSEARRATETERVAAVDEVERLRARREFLLGDVDQLEAFLVDQRDRLRTAAHEIESLAERVPGGLGTLTPPPMSASDDDPIVETGSGEAADTADDPETAETVAGEAGADEVASADEEAATGDDETADAEPQAGDEPQAESDDTPGDDAPAHAPFPGFVSEHGDDAEVVLPPETRMPFADASKLAEALGNADVLDDAPAPDDGGGGGVFDTSELDVTEVMEALDRRVRGESVPRRDDDVTGELPFRKPPSD